ncbi:TOG array regulator of axonemal microtubules protein 1-like [Diorhabda sublineata]|uniref:TOG array regulator of axonemal microtubules protein 1-like n=1 Tax=Diorhabda sublineata TaxID=1163346 RepID=UPI0024E0DC95|nr:TOG array regulator of axonemal microtubules protein 1-like [Diorhabda sublineata]
MSPTIASQSKNQSLQIKSIEKLIVPSRRARSISPRLHHKLIKTRASSSINVPFIDKSEASLRPGLKIHSYNDIGSKGELSTSSTETALSQALWKLRNPDWNKSLRGLADIIELCEYLGPESIRPHMTIINQRLTELIKSPRSHVSRSSCQAVGHIFKYIKDTRGPEFNELIDTLLCKCADSSKFIRHDANSALDCMVIHIPTFHAIRALCAKGPEHKNPLVRTATARLIVCATILAQPQNILHPQSNEYTRRRIILSMVGFLDDRHSEVRKYGERLYKILSKDRIFDFYLNKYLERDVVFKMKKIIKMN